MTREKGGLILQKNARPPLSPFRKHPLAILPSLFRLIPVRLFRLPQRSRCPLGAGARESSDPAAGRRRSAPGLLEHCARVADSIGGLPSMAPAVVRFPTDGICDTRPVAAPPPPSMAAPQIRRSLSPTSSTPLSPPRPLPTTSRRCPRSRPPASSCSPSPVPACPADSTSTPTPSSSSARPTSSSPKSPTRASPPARRS